MPNPFFSGRIPQDLYQRIEQHIAETGESKTHILINALAAYLKHPFKIQNTVVGSGVSLEMFTALEERVAALEQLLPNSGKTLITSDNNSDIIQPIVINTDNNPENSSDKSTAISFNAPDSLSDPWLETVTTTPKPENPIDKRDSTITSSVISPNKNVLLLAPPPTVENGNQLDNIDNNAKTIKPQQTKLFNESKETIGPYSESKMAQELGVDRNKLRKHVERIEKGEMPPNTPVKTAREGRLYHANYLGKPQGRKLWIAKVVEPETSDNA